MGTATVRSPTTETCVTGSVYSCSPLTPTPSAPPRFRCASPVHPMQRTRVARSPPSQKAAIPFPLAVYRTLNTTIDITFCHACPLCCISLRFKGFLSCQGTQTARSIKSQAADLNRWRPPEMTNPAVAGFVSTSNNYCLRRRAAAKPNMPKPNNAIVAGSGTSVVARPAFI
jgi:hypothetical protein